MIDGMPTDDPSFKAVCDAAYTENLTAQIRTDWSSAETRRREVCK